MSFNFSNKKVALAFQLNFHGHLSEHVVYAFNFTAIHCQIVVADNAPYMLEIFKATVVTTVEADEFIRFINSVKLNAIERATMLNPDVSEHDIQFIETSITKLKKAIFDIDLLGIYTSTTHVAINDRVSFKTKHGAIKDGVVVTIVPQNQTIYESMGQNLLKDYNYKVNIGAVNINRKNPLGNMYMVACDTSTKRKSKPVIYCVQPDLISTVNGDYVC